MPGRTGFRLNEEQHKEVRDCLTQAGVKLVEPFGDFVARVESSIDHFRAARPEGTFREAHDALRDLARLSRAVDPSPAQLRIRLKRLPSLALEDLGRRARVVMPRLFPGEALDGHLFEAPERAAARFLGWAESASPNKLVKALRSLSASGGRWVAGRSRGGGKRSAVRFEPRVLGVVRGSPEPKPAGGRPSKDACQELIAHLAFDWFHGTDNTPTPGRSDASGFGKLVHAVFEWLHVVMPATQEATDLAIEAAAEAASYALRRYFAEVESAKAESFASVTPSQFCVDCRWMVRQGDSLESFLCRRLNLTCATARDAAQACGLEGKLFQSLA